MEQLTLLANSGASFNLNYSFSFIKIKKIIVTSLLQSPTNEWINILSNFNISISYSSKQSITKTVELNLLGFLSPHHLQPVFDFENYEVPIENVRNITSFGDHFDKLNIELKPIGQLPNNTSITIFYISSPGVIKTK